MRIVVNIKIGRWSFAVDGEKTRAAYSRISIGAPERCGCLHCKNYAQAREYAYPKESREIFEKNGIDYSKEAEIYHMVKQKNGLQLYGGFFHLIREALLEEEVPERYEMLTDKFQYFISAKSDLLEDSFKGQNILQFEFVNQAPWVIDEEFPGPSEE
jgi:hypothetical protein